MIYLPHRINNELIPRIYEINSYLKPLFKPKISSGNNFIIFSSNRTGSTLLGTLLNSHPEINHAGEIFLKFSKCYYKKVHFPYWYIRGNQNSDFKYNSFEIKTQHMKHVFFKKDLNLVKKLYQKNWKVVYLKRNNIFRQALSHLIAMETGQWHNFPNTNFKNKKVYIDTEKLMNLIKWFENLSMEEEQKLNEVKYLQITYEDDLLDSKNHQLTCNKIFEFVGIPSYPVSTSIKKISSGNLSEQVTNFDEVQNHFSKTKYAKFL